VDDIALFSFADCAGCLVGIFPYCLPIYALQIKTVPCAMWGGLYYSLLVIIYNTKKPIPPGPVSLLLSFCSFKLHFKNVVIANYAERLSLYSSISEEANHYRIAVIAPYFKGLGLINTKTRRDPGFLPLSFGSFILHFKNFVIANYAERFSFYSSHSGGG
jgi:hypothetical protein